MGQRQRPEFRYLLDAMKCGGQVARKKWKSLGSTISLFAEIRGWLDFLLFAWKKSSVIARGADFIKLSSPSFPRNRNLRRYRRRWKVNIKAEERRERMSLDIRDASIVWPAESLFINLLFHSSARSTFRLSRRSVAYRCVSISSFRSFKTDSDNFFYKFSILSFSNIYDNGKFAVDFA